VHVPLRLPHQSYHAAEIALFFFVVPATRANVACDGSVTYALVVQDTTEASDSDTKVLPFVPLEPLFVDRVNELAGFDALLLALAEG
jgi:hypothetical protein